MPVGTCAYVISTNESFHADQGIFKHYKEYKWFQAVMSVVPWIQAISIMSGWGPTTSVHRLWSEMAVGALGGGATITTLFSKSIRTFPSQC